MRHSIYGKHLGRDKNQREALFKSLIRSLILSESIKTTEAKAKAIKGLVDRLITQAKSPTSRRLVGLFLTDKKIQEKLFNDLVPRLKTRDSGYASITKLGRRQGDKAMMVYVSLILDKEKVEPKSAQKDEVKPKQELRIKN